MHKQVISFAQVMKFLENMDLKGGFNPKPPPLRMPLVSSVSYCDILCSLMIAGKTRKARRGP